MNILFKGGAITAAIAMLAGNTVILAIGVLLMLVGLCLDMEGDCDE